MGASEGFLLGGRNDVLTALGLGADVAQVELVVSILGAGHRIVFGVTHLADGGPTLVNGTFPLGEHTLTEGRLVLLVGNRLGAIRHDERGALAGAE